VKILLSAGEASGDRIGAALARALREIDPSLELAGCAGPEMVRAGVRPLARAEDFAHSGWSSVLRHLPRLVRGAARYFREADLFRPRAVVALDAPGLNTPLLRRFEHLDPARTWVAPPQLWAWRDRRPAVLDGLHTHPLHAFEVPAQLAVGARAQWFGFPGLRPERAPGPRDLVALFPGSRKAWRNRHAALFLEAARLAVPHLTPVFAALDAAPGTTEIGVPSLPPDQVLSRAALALALPGTATLEIALQGIPAVVAARPTRLDAWIARRRLADGALALPNRILARTVFPEFASPSLRPSDLGSALRRAAALEGREPALDGFRELLGPDAAAERIARGVLERIRPDP
jgi:lipid-A-disaccharide synthase